MIHVNLIVDGTTVYSGSVSIEDIRKRAVTCASENVIKDIALSSDETVIDEFGSDLADIVEQEIVF